MKCHVCLDQSLPDSDTSVVAGFGSPHGDDEAGWQVVDLLQRRPDLPARLVKITEGTLLVDELEGCERLIVVDVCRGGAQVGSISQFEWPDPGIRQYHNHSRHGIWLCNALDVLQRIGRMPPRVVVFGIDIGYGQRPGEMNPEVLRAVKELDETIFAEICETVDERRVGVESSVATS